MCTLAGSRVGSSCGLPIIRFFVCFGRAAATAAPLCYGRAAGARAIEGGCYVTRLSPAPVNPMAILTASARSASVLKHSHKNTQTNLAPGSRLASRVVRRCRLRRHHRHRRRRFIAPRESSLSLPSRRTGRRTTFAHRSRNETATLF